MSTEITAKIHKAIGFRDKPAPSLHIVAYEEVPEIKSDSWESDYRAFYRQEAQQIVNALVKSLPGGTVDQVLCLLLERHASVFRVAHVVEETK